jgi:hypothetical protein
VSNFSGSGKRGFEDGAANVAKFTDLRGIVFYPPEKALFVGDNGNRKIRKISLVTGTFSSVSFSSLRSYSLKIGEVSTICDKINPRALAITSEGTLFVATLDQIFRLTTTSMKGERDELNKI